MVNRVAAIDCGTNSIRLLVAERDDTAPSGFVELDRRLTLTRLGQGVDATGRFAPDALQRTLDATADYAQVIAGFGAEKIRFVATSAARDASNREAFFTGVRDRLGVEADIIPGEEEAWLSFSGAVAVAGDVAAPTLMMDIGGGSTELVVGSLAEGVSAAVSLNVGSVRLRERFFHSDPITPAEIDAATAFIDELLDGSGIDGAAAHSWLGVGGTATSLAAIALKLEHYDRDQVQGASLDRDDLEHLTAWLLAAPVADIAALPTMQPQRADVIAGGALIAARVMARMNVDMTVSEADILDGLVAGLLKTT